MNLQSSMFPKHGRQHGQCRLANSSRLRRGNKHLSATSNKDPDPSVMASMLLSAMQAQQQRNSNSNQSAQNTAAHLNLKNVVYHPPGVEQPLLDNVNLQLSANKLGLVYGRSGSGKTTLLQVQIQAVLFFHSTCAKLCTISTPPRYHCS
jgi:ABC-type glutathione transport system ATPase component